MQVTFGIDVSKSTSTVCELIGESKNEFTITNDRPGFIQLLKELSAFSKHPQIIFEATGVYSRRLQAFLEDYDYDYVILNPLKAKKEMDMGLRHNKTDKTDAYHLALIQRLHHHPVKKLQSQTYKQLNSLSRFYDQLTSDLVMAKNRLHQALQSTFPEIETLFCSAKGKNYWKIVRHYPHCDLVEKDDKKQIVNWLMQLKGIGFKHAQKTADKLIELAHKAYPVVSSDSVEAEQAQYYAHRLLSLSKHREKIIEQMVKMAKSLSNHDLENLESIPGFAQITAVRVLAELGDLRRFSNPNKINAFVGIDPGRYQSGEMDSNLSITKHGNAVARKLLYRAIGQIALASKTNPCHI
ncbi:IS110 family transposase, partial [Lactobacillus xujianguonis]